MTLHDHNVISDFRVPIRMWTKGVPVEEDAIKQLGNLANMPFVYKHVSAMPDVHVGIGATVGSVVATSGAIIPAAVGVDIGCGMMACRLNLRASDLPDNLFGVRSAIEAAVPHGRTAEGGKGDKGGWDIFSSKTPDQIGLAWKLLHDDDRYQRTINKHPVILKANSYAHLGTLGTGNHFIELCLDENQDVWLMLHSGSRGVGNKIGQTFIELAKKEMERYFINLPDKDLAYLVEGSEYYNDYVDAVSWAQTFAKTNRNLMFDLAIDAVSDALDRPVFIDPTTIAINCHHNYVEKENHYGKNVLVTRKGAVRAREHDLGIIPGSMGAKSFIVRGKGNKESFCSCSHGAGRKMSRGGATRMITLDDHIKATEGVECRKDVDVIDESPAAYKDIDAVMAAQAHLVDIVHTLKQVVCVKG